MHRQLLTAPGTPTRPAADERPLAALERKQRLELAGIVAWSRSEVDYMIDRLGRSLRVKEWGSHESAVGQILRAVGELKVMVRTLEEELSA